MRYMILCIAMIGSVVLAGCPCKQQAGNVTEMAAQMREMNTMMVDMLNGGDAQFDCRFIDLMIPHHEGAIAMAQKALAESDRAELKEMAQMMITAQQEEIAKLESWRAQWCNK